MELGFWGIRQAYFHNNSSRKFLRDLLYTGCFKEFGGLRTEYESHSRIAKSRGYRVTSAAALASTAEVSTDGRNEMKSTV
jgi:hypothetical protein